MPPRRRAHLQLVAGSPESNTAEHVTDEAAITRAEAALAEVLAGPEGQHDPDVRARAAALAQAIISGNPVPHDG